MWRCRKKSNTYSIVKVWGTAKKSRGGKPLAIFQPVALPVFFAIPYRAEHPIVVLVVGKVVAVLFHMPYVWVLRFRLVVHFSILVL